MLKMNFINARRVTTMILIVVVIAITGCRKDAETPIDRLVGDKRVDEVVILFENDVHGAIDGYPIFAGYRDAVADTFKYVVTVSCGDCLSGGPLAAFYQGQSIVDIMKSVGYDYFVPGNHDFDFSMTTFLNFLDETNVYPICCNFNDRATGMPVTLLPYTLRRQTWKSRSTAL